MMAIYRRAKRGLEDWGRSMLPKMRWGAPKGGSSALFLDRDPDLDRVRAHTDAITDEIREIARIRRIDEEIRVRRRE